jgi:hypothetical protein
MALINIEIEELEPGQKVSVCYAVEMAGYLDAGIVEGTFRGFTRSGKVKLTDDDGFEAVFLPRDIQTVSVYG